MTDLDEALVRAGRYLRRGVVSADLRTLEKTGGRAARLPAGGGVLLVHVLADPGQVPVRPRRAAGDVPGGQGGARR